ncbi:MAG TPA: HepT-like ribonuclease domain-containing protein [Cytophagales bacterium]|nr:HepT-like ribonuclease domain-containing protein [Cytophagales bacterium]
MENEIKTWLADIKQAIEEINMFLPDKKDFFEFRKDLKTKRAIERNVEIIGEAVSRILKAHPKFPITNSRKIVDTRNRISHGYDSVSEDIIWSIVVRDLPILDAEIDSLLDEENY